MGNSRQYKIMGVTRYKTSRQKAKTNVEGRREIKQR